MSIRICSGILLAVLVCIAFFYYRVTNSYTLLDVHCLMIIDIVFGIVLTVFVYEFWFTRRLR